MKIWDSVYVFGMLYLCNKGHLMPRNKKIIKYFHFKLYFSRALGGIADVAAWGAVLSILMKLFPKQVKNIKLRRVLHFNKVQL